MESSDFAFFSRFNKFEFQIHMIYVGSFIENKSGSPFSVILLFVPTLESIFHGIDQAIIDILYPTHFPLFDTMV